MERRSALAAFVMCAVCAACRAGRAPAPPLREPRSLGLPPLPPPSVQRAERYAPYDTPVASAAFGCPFGAEWNGHACIVARPRGDDGIMWRPDPTRFDADAASAVLRGIDLGPCTNGPLGARCSVATVTFDRSGQVIEVRLGRGFAGTSTGDCIAEKLASARAPAFRGAPATVVRVLDLE